MKMDATLFIDGQEHTIVGASVTLPPFAEVSIDMTKLCGLDHDAAASILRARLRAAGFRFNDKGDLVGRWERTVAPDSAVVRIRQWCAV